MTWGVKVSRGKSLKVIPGDCTWKEMVTRSRITLRDMWLAMATQVFHRHRAHARSFANRFNNWSPSESSTAQETRNFLQRYLYPPDIDVLLLYAHSSILVGTSLCPKFQLSPTWQNNVCDHTIHIMNGYYIGSGVSFGHGRWNFGAECASDGSNGMVRWNRLLWLISSWRLLVLVVIHEVMIMEFRTHISRKLYSKLYVACHLDGLRPPPCSITSSKPTPRIPRSHCLFHF